MEAVYEIYDPSAGRIIWHGNAASKGDAWNKAGYGPDSVRGDGLAIIQVKWSDEEKDWIPISRTLKR